MLGWSIVALKRGDHQVAHGRLARARELLNGKPAPALWYWAASLASAGLDDAEGALKAARDGRRGVSRQRRAAEQSRRAARAERRHRRAPRRCCAPRWPRIPSLPQVSKNLADILYRNGRYEEAAEAYERAAKLNPELGDDLYFKLGNIAYKKRDHARARESWAQATALNPGHELARANLEMLDLAQ